MRAVFYNGAFSEYERLSIPLCDRSVFFGDGVYDVAIGAGGGVYLCEEHLDRFYDNIEKIGLLPYCDRDELKKIIGEVISRCGYESYMVYMQASGRSGVRSHSRESMESNLLVFASEFVLPSTAMPMRVRTVRDRRYELCDIKTINLLPSVIESSEGERLGYDESVFVKDKYVTECAHSSIAIVKNGELITHPLSNAILPSITRGRVLSICGELGIPFSERKFSVEELYRADEVLIMSTTKLCRPVSEADGVKYRWEYLQVGDRIFKALWADFRLNLTNVN